MKKAIKLAVALMFIGLCSFTGTEKGYQVGDKAGSFKLKNVDGKMVSLEDYGKSKGVILVFTCNHCPYSKKYEGRILELDKNFKKQGWPVVAISSNDPKVEPDDSFENMQKLAKEKRYSFPYLFDETQEVAKAFGATKTPHVFLLENKNGNFTVQYIGAIDDNAEDAKAVTVKYVEKAIQQLGDGREPDPSVTKAIGCTIKWKKAAE
jgi:peroxiredoxin